MYVFPHKYMKLVPFYRVLGCCNKSVRLANSEGERRPTELYRLAVERPKWLESNKTNQLTYT